MWGGGGVGDCGFKVSVPLLHDAVLTFSGEIGESLSQEASEHAREVVTSLIQASTTSSKPTASSAFAMGIKRLPPQLARLLSIRRPAAQNCDERMGQNRHVEVVGAMFMSGPGATVFLTSE